MHYHPLLVSCLLLASIRSTAQKDVLSQKLTIQQDSVAVPYYPSSDESLPVYNGRFFYGYSSISQGIAFYGGNQWQSGAILYDGVWYHSIPIRYDEITDRVVARTPKSVTITLLPEHIQQFQIGEATFVRLLPDEHRVLREGFYRVVSEGSVTLLERYVSRLNEVINDIDIARNIETSTYFYALKDGRYYELKRPKTLLVLLKNKRKQIAQYLKEQKVKPRKNPEKAFTLMASFYNQSQP
ncbi:MAG TPA: hypothetical protein VK644_11510 [Chitinophagaceae bacterium]|nr:hypothetical protein [Chitinophagaceae bacterium]